MENVTVDFNGTTTEKYQISLFDLTLNIHNITKYSKTTRSRGRYIPTVSCEVYLRRFKILELNQHWRPGTDLPLDWLSDSKKLYQCFLQDCIRQFGDYCYSSIDYLKHNKSFYYLMNDFWCFNHENMQSCLKDFISAYNIYYNCDLLLVDFSSTEFNLEDAWNSSYNFEPDLDYLFTTQFITIKV